jgi:hypothetical protein
MNNRPRLRREQVKKSRLRWKTKTPINKKGLRWKTTDPGKEQHCQIMNKNTQLKKRSGKEIHIPVENKDTIKEKEAQSENN